MRFILLLLFTLAPLSARAWQVDPSRLQLVPPPTPGSARDSADFDALLEYQRARTPEECQEAARETYPSMKAFFGPQLGILSDREFAAVEAFGNELIETVTASAEPFKERWLRKRPYDRDRAVVPCIRRPGGNKSYPSAHAAAGAALGEVLSGIFPAKEAAIREQGRRIGTYRVLSGVHHPSDVEAGESLANQVLSELERDPDFVRRLRAIRRP